METKTLIIRESISLITLEPLLMKWHKTMVKGVADIERGIIALGAEWHTDAKKVLIDDGSKAKNLWGFKIYPAETGLRTVQYVSHINIRPEDGNMGTEITHRELREKILNLIKKYIPELAV